MALPIPQPSYIFRGHSSSAHHVSFLRSNTRLCTGDSEGFLIFWSLATRRPAACWRAHDGAILSVKEWGGGRMITHGKDNTLRVWKFAEEDEAGLDKTLPVDGQGAENRKPWLLYELPVNTLNFCSFGMCVAQDLSGAKVVVDQISEDRQLDKKGAAEYEDLLVGVPNTLISEAVDIFHLPSCKRLMTVPGPSEDSKPINTGMVMALSLLYLPSPSSTSPPGQLGQSPRLTLVTGYESGHTYVQQVLPTVGWTPLYLAHTGKQPILSLSVDPSAEKAYYLTSGADAVVAKHPLASLSPSLPYEAPIIPQPTSSSNTASQQSDLPSTPQGLLSAALKSAPASSQPPPPIKPPALHTAPLKVNNTHHSGQQSLTLRSDAKIFATAGWDGRARVHSAKSLKEVAVLKWHKEGVMSVDFAEVRDDQQDDTAEKEGEGRGSVKKMGALSVAQKRIKEATKTHWVAVGGKDGKVSLWDIY